MKKKSVSLCIRLSTQYSYFLIARKYIVDYTRLAAISLCSSFLRFLHCRRLTPSLPVPLRHPHPILLWTPPYFGTVFYALSALLLLEQFGQRRKESEGTVTDLPSITVNVLLYTEEYYYTDNQDAFL